MLEQEQEPTVCYNCDEEFVVQSSYTEEPVVCFCPFCGSELADSDQEDYMDDEEDEDGDTFFNDRMN